MLSTFDNTGHMVVNDPKDLEYIKTLVELSHIKGVVDTSDIFFKAFMYDYGNARGLKPDLLVWTTVFIPKLMWSIIRYQDQEISRLITLDIN